jgi:hypothetical protein
MAAFLTPRVETVRFRPHVGMSKGLKVQKGIRKFTPDVTYILVILKSLFFWTFQKRVVQDGVNIRRSYRDCVIYCLIQCPPSGY